MNKINPKKSYGLNKIDAFKLYLKPMLNKLKVIEGLF